MAEREYPKHKPQGGWTDKALRDYWFKQYIEIDGDCWKWTGARTNAGTPSTTIKYRHPVSRRRLYSVMRVLKAIDDPKFKQPRFSSSKCEKHGRICVNPDHWDWSRSLKIKPGNRAARASKGNYKLTPEQVLEIRQLLKDGMSAGLIAKRYGLHPVSVHHIKNGKRWKWLKTAKDLERERAKSDDQNA